MDWTFLLDYFQAAVPWASNALVILGSLVIIGTVVDAAIPDEKDGGFMKKLMAAPLIGALLEQVKRFSPFNIKDKEE